jgi:uncharacterized protein
VNRALAAFALAALAAAAAFAQPLQPVPALRARVTDLTGTLSGAEQRALEQKLAAFEARKGAQVAVLIVPTTQPEAIEQYSIRVVEAWALGRAASDDGALLLVAKDDRALRIEVGYGLEGALNDARANRIIDEAILPRFRVGDFAGGIGAGVDRMLGVIDGEPLPEPPASRQWSDDSARGFSPLFPFALFAIPVAGGVLRRIFGRVLGPLITAAAIFALVWVATRLLVLAIVVALIAGIFSAGSGARPRGRYRRGHHDSWGGLSGGSFGDGGFGGGSFGGGGFSGGGGGFGGGGASGRW